MLESKEEYKRLRRIGWRARNAFDAAKVEEEWDRLDEGKGPLVFEELTPEDTGGLVAFQVMPDHDPSTCLDFDGSEADHERERKRLNSEGAWGIVGSYRIDGNSPWVHADSVWGFIGDDWKDSGYDHDVKAGTMAERLEAIETRTANKKALVLVNAASDYLQNSDPETAYALDNVADAAAAHWGIEGSDE